MNIRVEFDIVETDLARAIEKAEARIRAFAPSLPLDGWHVSVTCEPDDSLVAARVDPLEWRCSFRAHRGAVSDIPLYSSS